MPGGGSILGMITSLSNNKKLLRSKRLFKKERTFLNIKREYLHAIEGKLNLKNASKEELLKIRQKLIHERIKQKRKKIFILSGVLLLFMSFLSYFIFGLIQNDINAIQHEKARKFKAKESEFLDYISYGDEWFEKGKWHNSIFYYKKANNIFPDNFDVNYRLVRSFSYHCENDFKNCFEAKDLLESMFSKFPEKRTELLEIKNILEIEY